MGKEKFIDLFGFYDSSTNEEVEEVVQEVKSTSGAEFIENEVEEVPQEVEEKNEEVEEVEESSKVEDVSLSDDEKYYESIMQDYIDSDVLDIDDDEIEVDFNKDGLKELITKTKEVAARKAVDSFKESLGQSAQTLLEVLQKGGSVDDYLEMNQEVDFSMIPLEDKHGKPLTNNQLNLIEDWLKAANYSPEEIAETLEDYMDAGEKMIRKQAELAQKKLAAKQQTDNQLKLKQVEENRIKQEQENIKQAEQFRDYVYATREIAGFKINETKARKLYDYVTKADKNGLTQFQKDDTEENRLLYAYFAMEGFDKSKLSKEIVTEQTRTLRKKLSEPSDTLANPKRGAQQVRRSDQGGIDIKWDMI